MKLEKLTKTNIDLIKKKRICCLEASHEYIEEMEHKYKLLDHIDVTLKRKLHSRRSIVVGIKEFTLHEFSYLASIDVENYEFIITDGFYREVYEYLVEINIPEMKEKTIYFFPNRNTEIYLEYVEKFKSRKLEDIIVFRSGPMKNAYIKGMDFYDNARALFEYMLEIGYNQKYKLVWLVKNPEDFQQYVNVKNVHFLSFDWAESPDKEKRDAYYRALCLAKYIFFTDAYGFAREARKDQVRVQLWHGCGYKERISFGSCKRRYEYFTVVSDLYAKIFQKSFGLDPSQMLITGYPKADWLFQKPAHDYKEMLDFPKANKYIFWLPTFRTTCIKQLSQLDEYSDFTETGLPIVISKEKLDELNDLLRKKDIVIIVKIHPFQDKNKMFVNSCSNIKLIDNEDLNKHDIMINQLLTCADALVTDYSSVAIDYLLLNRPIAFTLDDLDEYTSSRGFFFDNIREWLPGKEVWTMEDLFDFIEMIANGKDYDRTKRRILCEKMHDFYDGNSCKRLIDILGI